MTFNLGLLGRALDEARQQRQFGLGDMLRAVAQSRSAVPEPDGPARYAPVSPVAYGLGRAQETLRRSQYPPVYQGDSLQYLRDIGEYQSALRSVQRGKETLASSLRAQAAAQPAPVAPDPWQMGRNESLIGAGIAALGSLFGARSAPAHFARYVQNRTADERERQALAYQREVAEFQRRQGETERKAKEASESAAQYGEIAGKAQSGGSALLPQLGALEVAGRKAFDTSQGKELGRGAGTLENLGSFMEVYEAQGFSTEDALMAALDAYYPSVGKGAVSRDNLELRRREVESNIERLKANDAWNRWFKPIELNARLIMEAARVNAGANSQFTSQYLGALGKTTAAGAAAMEAEGALESIDSRIESLSADLMSGEFLDPGQRAKTEAELQKLRDARPAKVDKAKALRNVADQLATELGRLKVPDPVIAPQVPATDGPPPEAGGAASPGLKDEVLGFFQGRAGDPYRSGGGHARGKEESKVDCSGLICEMVEAFGLPSPGGVTGEMASRSDPVSSPQFGDLVFENGGKHVGFYIGNGQAWYSDSSSGVRMRRPVKGAYYRRPRAWKGIFSSTGLTVGDVV